MSHEADRIWILQWNKIGVRAKLPLLHLTLPEERYDIILLQKILLIFDINLPSYIGSTHLERTGESPYLSDRIYMQNPSPYETTVARR